MAALLTPSFSTTRLTFSTECCCCMLPYPLRSSVSTVFSRSFASSTSVRTSRLMPTGRGGDDTPLEVAEAPPSALRTASRNTPIEQAKRDKRNHRQLPYNAYNIQLSQNIKQLHTWHSILTLLASELSTTNYNTQTISSYTHPNKKYTQLTHQTLHAITAQLIRYRSSRHSVVGAEGGRLMVVLGEFVRVLECAAPAMYEGRVNGGRWRLLHQPYRYLRAVVEQWRKESAGKVRRKVKDEEERAEEEDVRRRGGLTAEDMKRLVEEAKRRRKEQRAAEAGGNVEEGRAGRDRLVNTMEGGVTDEEQRDLDALSDDQKLRMQVKVLMEQDREGAEKALKQEADEGSEDEKPKSRRDRKVRSFFSSPQ